MVLHVSWLSKLIMICGVLCKVKQLHYGVKCCYSEQFDLMVRVISGVKRKISFPLWKGFGL